MNIIMTDGFLKNSPNLSSSKGNQTKRYADNKWYKLDSMGYEGLAEVLVSRLLEKTNIFDFVSYSPVKILYNGREYKGCVSDNFKADNETLITFENLHRAYRGTGLADVLGRIGSVSERIKYTADFAEKVTGLSDIGKYLTVLLTLDAFFMNEDRHTHNIAVLRDENTLKYRLAPVFDNGLSLLSDLNGYPADGDVYEFIGKVRAKPFSEDFDEQLDAAESIYGRQVSFGFSKNDVSEELSALSDYYDEGILYRVRDIVFERIRKYSYLFE